MAGAGPAAAQTGDGGFQPARHPKDAWLRELPGNHRGYDDAIWAKSGSSFMRNADSVPVTNPMKVPAANNGQHSLPELVEKGVQFAVCSRATRRMAGAIATATGATVDAVCAELAAGLIPNARPVPAGVIAATRAQEMG